VSVASPIPPTPAARLEEIAAAYADALDALAFAPAAGIDAREEVADLTVRFAPRVQRVIVIFGPSAL
jgi:hypothetical protein